MQMGDVVVFIGTSNSNDLDSNASRIYGLVVGNRYVVSATKNNYVLVQGKEAIWLSNSFFVLQSD